MNRQCIQAARVCQIAVLLGLAWAIGQGVGERRREVHFTRVVPFRGPDTMHGLFAITLGTEGTIWACDFREHKLYQFREDGELLTSFPLDGPDSAGRTGFVNEIAYVEGILYTKDSPTCTILRFAPDGTYRGMAVDGKALGLKRVLGFAVGPAGETYLCDQEQSAVLVKRPDADDLKVFCSRKTHAKGPHQPVGVAVDSEGDVWVLDKERRSLGKYSPKGKSLLYVPLDPISKRLDPKVIRFCAPGTILVLDDRPKEILAFSLAGDLVARYFFGKRCLDDFAMTPDGRVYVSNDCDQVIEAFEDTGEPRPPFTRPVPTGELQELSKTDMRLYGQLHSANGLARLRWEETMRVVRPDGKETILTQTAKIGGRGKLIDISDFAVDPEGCVWVAERRHSKVEKFSSQGESLLVIDEFHHECMRGQSPRGVAVHGGTLYVVTVDPAAIVPLERVNRLLQFDLLGRYLGDVKLPVSLGMNEYIGIDVTRDGKLVLSSCSEQKVILLNSDGTIEKLPTDAEPVLQQLAGVAVRDDGAIAVADVSDRVLLIAPDGSIQRELGTGEQGPARNYIPKPGGVRFKRREDTVRQPSGVAFASNGHLYVTEYGDRAGGRVLEYDRDGTFVGELTSPKMRGWYSGVKVCGDDEIYVASFGTSEICKLSLTTPPATTNGGATRGGRAPMPGGPGGSGNESRLPNGTWAGPSLKAQVTDTRGTSPMRFR